MLILAIDTSTRAGSIAVLRDSEVLAEISAREDTPYSTRLFRDLELLQSRAQFRMNQVDVFAVAAGPGSFTGLRVGLTAVKGWAEVHAKPIAAVSGLEAIAAQATANHEVISPFLDARKGYVFGSTYRRGPGRLGVLELIGEEAILTIEEFLSQVKQKCDDLQAVLVSETPEVLPHNLVESMLPGAHIEQVSASLAPTIGLLGFERANRGDLVDALGLDANYIRRSDAEVARTGT
ncbi:MAG: glycoprotease protein family er [Candidatus Acidoferrum typicum]|nr:glycoprotease protein family er [Candidatus Acidoferrum typicum]